jgi:transposase
MQDVQDEPLFAERVAGLDIAKAEAEVTIRVPSDTTAGRRQQEARTFRTTRRELLDLADWLRSWGVTKVGMEAAGDYWKPVFFLLESQGLDCELYNAAQVKALPGRPKTDRADSIRLAKITERGMISSSFVPPEPIRALRTRTRYRRHLTQARTAEKQRAGKLLEDGHLKLSSVISDIHGVSGRDMLDAIAAGQRDPKALAQLARGSMRGKIRRLEEAPDCSFFTGEHAAVLVMMLTVTGHYSAQIETLTARIEALAAPYLHQVQQLGDIPGIGPLCAQDIIAEIGTDMTVFPAASHLVSWARWSPQVKQSAGKRKGSNPRRPRQPLPGRRPGRERRGRRAHPVVPGRQVPAAGPPHAQEKSPGRHRQLHAHRHARAAQRSRRPLHRPGRRLLRNSHARPPAGPQPRPQPGTPGLPGHHPGPQPRHQPAPHRG